MAETDETMTVGVASDASTRTKDRYIPRLLHFRVTNSHLQVEEELEVAENAIHDIMASPVLNRLSSSLMSCLEKPDEPDDIAFFDLHEGEMAHRICIMCMVHPHPFSTRRLLKKLSRRTSYRSLLRGSLDFEGFMDMEA